MMPAQIRRSRLEMKAAILQAVLDGEYKPTRIMYRCNLAWRTAQTLLEELIATGLIEGRDNRGKIKKTDYRSPYTYHITEDGETQLKAFDKLLRLLDVG